MWLCPVYPRHSRPVMSAECVFSVQALYDDAGVKEGAAEEPEGGSESAWLCRDISACRLIRLKARRTGSRS